MKYTQPRLPYVPDALMPVISQRTVDYHYGKHEKAYIDKLNELIVGTEYEELPIEEIIRKASGPLFNNASQAWNHIFYFFQMSPNPKKEPEGKLRKKIDERFGSPDEMKKKMEEAGISLFGSGWVWLSADDAGNLFISQGLNADNPLRDGLHPLMVIDVWEHAYYLDYQNRRADYLKEIWKLIDWSVIEKRYEEF